MNVPIHIVKDYGITYADGSFVAWADFLIDEPAFVMPSGAERIEYIPNERQSFFTNGTQYGDAEFKGAWVDGDRFLSRKHELVANAIARKPIPPIPPDLDLVNTAIADAKIAIDNYFVDPAADSKLVPVLQALRAVL